MYNDGDTEDIEKMEEVGFRGEEGLDDADESVEMILNDEQDGKEQVENDIGVEMVPIVKETTEDQSTSYRL